MIPIPLLWMDYWGYGQSQFLALRYFEPVEKVGYVLFHRDKNENDTITWAMLIIEL